MGMWENEGGLPAGPPPRPRIRNVKIVRSLSWLRSWDSSTTTRGNETTPRHQRQRQRQEERGKTKRQRQRQRGGAERQDANLPGQPGRINKTCRYSGCLAPYSRGNPAVEAGDQGVSTKSGASQPWIGAAERRHTGPGSSGDHRVRALRWKGFPTDIGTHLLKNTMPARGPSSCEKDQYLCSGTDASTATF